MGQSTDNHPSRRSTLMLWLPLVVILVFNGWCGFVLATDAGASVDSLTATGGPNRMGPATGTGTTVKKDLGTESPFEAPTPASADESLMMGPIPVPGAGEDNGDISELLPKEGSTFSKDVIDPNMLADMDCHMRNLDLCYAGMLGASAKMLPETDAELEARCDEMQAVTSCIAVYIKRCSSFKLLSTLLPTGGMSQSKALLPQDIKEMEIPGELFEDGNGRRPTTKIRAIDLIELCEPSAKGTKANRQLREKLYQLSRCIQPRVRLLRPCIEDMKVALQLFYEPGKNLPLEPSCCAVSRFRQCARGALDGVCGISSFAQLESALASGPGRQVTAILERSCRRRASSHETEFCREVLPPSGLKAPPRRGRKLSKLAKVLDLFSFAPT